ncbi:MBL fold metallo-hydrolase [Williamsia sp. SKLECPSW1]
MTRSSPAWTEPGCHVVVDGVHRIPLELPNDALRAVNVYVLETDRGIALVDGGWHLPTTHEELRSALSTVGRVPEDIHDVFVTHIHRDHYTFAVELRRRVGCRVHLGIAEAPGLDAVARIASTVPETSLRQARRGGAPELADAVYRITVDEPFDVTDWEHPDEWIRPGPLALPGRHVEAVHTPGHTKGHMIFRDLDNSVCFTGDHVLPTITPSIGFELGDWDLPLEAFLASLGLVASDAADTIAPAHGPVGGRVDDRARALIEHHRRRFDEILDIVEAADAELTGSTVARALRWTRRDRPFSDLDTMNRLIALCETMAHLDVLAARGRVGVTTTDGVDRFRTRQRSAIG